MAAVILDIRTGEQWQVPNGRIPLDRVVVRRHRHGKH